MGQMQSMSSATQEIRLNKVKNRIVKRLNHKIFKSHLRMRFALKHDRLLQTFFDEIHDADEAAFHQAAHSFLNLWDYEYGHASNMPSEIHQYIGQLAYDSELGEE